MDERTHPVTRIGKDRENISQNKFSRTKPSLSIHADATVLMKKKKSEMRCRFFLLVWWKTRPLDGHLEVLLITSLSFQYRYLGKISY